MDGKERPGGLHTRRIINPAAGVAILASLTILVFLFVSVVLYRAGMLKLPSFLASILGGDDATDTGTPSPSLFEVLRSYSKDTDNPDVIDINDPDVLTAALLAVQTPQTYYNVTKTVYTPIGSRPTERKSEILKDGSNFVVKVTDTSRGKVIKTVRGNGVDIRISGDGGLTRTFSATSDFSIAEEAGIPDLADIAALIKSYTDAEGVNSENNKGKISNYNISLSIKDSQSYLDISFEYEELGIIESYLISLDYNFVWSATVSNTDGYIYYKMQTTVFTTDIKGKKIT